MLGCDPASGGRDSWRVGNRLCKWGVRWLFFGGQEEEEGAAAAGCGGSDGGG